MSEFSLWIPGIPKTAQTGNIVRLKDGRTFKKREHSGWFDYLRLYITEHRPTVPFDGALEVSVTFVRPDLASSTRAYPITRPDVENLAKAVMDCGNGVLWHDDAQIVDLKLEKRYARNTEWQAPGIFLCLWGKVR